MIVNVFILLAIHGFNCTRAFHGVHGEVAVKYVVFLGTVFQKITMSHVVIAEVVLDLKT